MIGKTPPKSSNAWKSAAVAAGLLAAAASAAPPGRPNILHIHADDHRADALHALGTPLLQTPNLDQLVAQGVTFTRCYTMGSMVGAVCLPSRTMLQTGRSWRRIPGAPAAAPNAADPATFIASVLGAAGYETFSMGKTGNEFTPGLKTFQTHVADDARGVARAAASRNLADTVIKHLQARDRAKPFYLYLAPPVPHDPRSAEPRFHELYGAAQIPLPPAFAPQHPFDNGEMTVRDEKLAPWPRTPEDTKQQIADYYACISGLDFHVGRIFEQLRESGEWTNTVVVFSGDNGLSLGDHGLFGKQNLYEFGGMHVPLVVAGPGIPKGRREALVYLMDLYPTFCELAGAPVPEGVEGRSLLPVAQGRQERVRDVLYTAYRDCMRAVRDDRWKLIRYPLVDRTQLFDLQADPHELNNRATDPAQAGKVAELMAILEREQKAYADTFPLRVEHPRPAAWTPPAPGTPPAEKAKKRKADRG